MQQQLCRNSTALLADHHRPDGSPHTMKPTRDDITKHLESLRARLGFARFKMRNGWEKSTLVDVEHLWRQKQQQLMNDIPKPRFTQQDIIEKRTYLQSSAALNAKHKKAKLTRTLSNPTRWFKEPPSPAPTTSTRPRPRDATGRCRGRNTPTRTYQRAADDIWGMESIPRSQQDMSTKKRGRTLLDEVEAADHGPCMVRNSLDYLSYAIAMTEGHARDDSISCSQPLPDVSRMEPNLLDEEDEERTYGRRSMELNTALSGDETESDDAASGPNSPVTAAAHAIMMFVNSHSASTASV